MTTRAIFRDDDDPWTDADGLTYATDHHASITAEGRVAVFGMHGHWAADERGRAWAEMILNRRAYDPADPITASWEPDQAERYECITEKGVKRAVAPPFLSTWQLLWPDS